MLPGILNQLGTESLSSLKKLASTVAGGKMFIQKMSATAFFFFWRIIFTCVCFYFSEILYLNAELDVNNYKWQLPHISMLH